MCKLQERGDIAPDIDVGKASHLLFSMKSKLFLNFIASSSMPLSRHRKDVHKAVGYFFRGMGVPSPQKVSDRREKLLSRHVLSKVVTQ